MKQDKKQILSQILSDFERDYNEEVFCDAEELIKAYKRLVATLIKLHVIDLVFAEDISFALNEKLQYFEEWY